MGGLVRCLVIFSQLVDAQPWVVCRVPRERSLPGYSRGCGRADGPPCARGTACEPRAHDHSRWDILPETNASGQRRNGGDHTKGPLWCRGTSRVHLLIVSTDAFQYVPLTDRPKGDV